MSSNYLDNIKRYLISHNLKPRYSDAVDHSPSDIFRIFGTRCADVDKIIYNDKLETCAIFDFKHNGIFGSASSTYQININEYSLQYIHGLSERENAPFFGGITYTKLNEQENPMFCLLGINFMAKSKLQEFLGKKHPIWAAWMTPQRLARFACFLVKKEIDIKTTEMHQVLPDIHHVYPLPKIVCHSDNYRSVNCSCQWCRLTDYNNEKLVK